MPGKSYGTQLNTLLKALSAVREIDEVIPIQTVQVLLSIALRPGLTMQELGDMTGLSQSSCSRNVAALGEWHRFGKEGYNLVEAVEDPRERRRKIMYLTHKGRQRVAKIIQSVTDEVVEFSSPNPREALKDAYAARRELHKN